MATTSQRTARTFERTSKLAVAISAIVLLAMVVDSFIGLGFNTPIADVGIAGFGFLVAVLLRVTGAAFLRLFGFLD